LPQRRAHDSTAGTERIVVGEYLTGVGCSACQAHEEAFDSLLQRYPSTQFIALAYHGTINYPLADPVDSLWERMYDWYGKPALHITGVFPQKYEEDWIDGHATESMSFAFGDDPVAFNVHSMATAIEAQRKRAPEAVLQIDATPNTGKLVTHVRVDSLAPEHHDVYVRLLVVEDTVRLKRTAPFDTGYYPRATHYMVVRAAARDAAHTMGLPLHGPGTITYTFDMAKVQARILRSWALGAGAVPGSEEKEAAQDLKSLFAVFSDKSNWTINPARLHVVALVQDAHTGDVLQAAMIPVGRGLTL
jgi:hypothetical protein